jgi:hypothetical protein
MKIKLSFYLIEKYFLLINFFNSKKILKMIFKKLLFINQTGYKSNTVSKKSRGNGIFLKFLKK